MKWTHPGYPAAHANVWSSAYTNLRWGSPYSMTTRCRKEMVAADKSHLKSGILHTEAAWANTNFKNNSRLSSLSFYSLFTAQTRFFSSLSSKLDLTLHPDFWLVFLRKAFLFKTLLMYENHSSHHSMYWGCSFFFENHLCRWPSSLLWSQQSTLCCLLLIPCLFVPTASH